MTTKTLTDQIEVISEGSHGPDDSPSGTRVVTVELSHDFRGDNSIEEVREMLHTFACRELEMVEQHGGPGQHFSERPHIHLDTTEDGWIGEYAVISQFKGLDV